MAWTEEDKKKMDDAAEAAGQDLTQGGVTAEALEAMGNWWKKHYMAAGHKRLAKMVLGYASKEQKPEMVMNLETMAFEPAVAK